MEETISLKCLDLLRSVKQTHMEEGLIHTGIQKGDQLIQ